jgi:hypothetical protein
MVAIPHPGRGSGGSAVSGRLREESLGGTRFGAALSADQWSALSLRREPTSLGISESAAREFAPLVSEPGSS